MTVVLGLGEMGHALAAAFVAGGHPTTVWNRTPGKAPAGAVEASSVREAVAGGGLIVVSVKGNSVARALLESAGDLRGRAVLNLTDGTSDEARAVADWAASAGVEYLHGQIMTIAPGIGHPDAVIFYGGAASVHSAHSAELSLLGGRGTLVSADPGAPTLFGMAVHDTMWGTLNGFLHAAALLTDAGIPVTDFLSKASPSMSALLGYLPSLASEVDSGSHALEFGALQHHLPSVEDLVRESKARGINTEFAAYTQRLVSDAIEAGHANDSYSRLIDHFRKGD
ncbi:NAD(P)-dependent oxidoreductase [Amycolatopsis sp. 195334CR]|uniref:NAD(P)-dependent oxidoreductase n=1 Tax=Amycolatopsis sp. 195334CR TaxID=2814588 RepID=UPI001A8E43A6|nr:NAD(P)-binding domain-containing protein [Amycolatopsis sp. 195334CR]MBN6035052.1 NAD(P)-dependent oxidoreductase [Amycolatopsis sp. 195334CR]